jgi:hypothetical protein
MKRRVLFILAWSVLTLWTSPGGLRLQAARPPQDARRSAVTQKAVLDKYCVSCHNQRAQVAGMSSSVLVTLDNVDLTKIAENGEVLEKVVRKLRTGMMPPAGAPRDKAANGALASWLETELDRAAASNPNYGRAALHRLNRTEYQNAVRDLLAIDIDTATLLPADSSSFGFDNIAGSLVISPVLLERYVASASKISRLAVGDLSQDPVETKYYVPPDLTQTGHIEGLPLGTRGGMLVQHNFPVDGEYVIKIDLLTRNGYLLVGNNTARGEKIELIIDGARVRLFDVTDYDGDPDATDKPGLVVRLPLAAGPHTIGAAFLRRNHAPVEDAVQPFEYSLVDPTYGGVTVVPHLSHFTITGPYGVTGRGDSPSRRRIFTCRPATASEEEACARQIVSTLARRAYRRPSNAEDLESLMGFYDEGRKKGSFDDGIEMALRRILASPEFVFRFERDPANLRGAPNYRVSDLELASRLSFFLWSSIPDDELIQVAAQNKLRDPAVLEQQVRRMLADPRSDAIVQNFAGQWLYLRNLKTKGSSFEDFPDFDDNLRQALRRETEMFFTSIMRDDRSVLDLLTADYTFLNERLAKHYGISGIYGSHYRRVTYGDDSRRGLLGQGSILMVTSYPNRTSPVQRGKWILENVLGAPAPTPPPNVPELEEKPPQGQRERSVRERMEEHRTNPVCSGCHKIMDPIGLSLENFDAQGRWRTRDAGVAIDATGELLDGTRVDGPATLRQALLGYSDQFVQTMAEKLFTYALGRGLEYYDLPAVRLAVRESAKNEHRFVSLVMGIVKSAPFQMRAVESQTGAGDTASRQ